MGRAQTDLDDWVSLIREVDTSIENLKTSELVFLLIFETFSFLSLLNPSAADFSSALRHKGMTLNFFFTLMEWVIPRMEPYVDIRLNEEFLSSRTAPGGLRSEAPKAGEGSKRPFLLGKAAQDGEGVARNSVRWPKTENGDRLTKMVFFEEERWNEGSEEWFTAGCLLPRDHASCLRFRDDTSHMIEHDHHPHTASRAPRVPHLSKVQKRRQQEEEQIQREKSPEV